MLPLRNARLGVRGGRRRLQRQDRTSSPALANALADRRAARAAAGGAAGFSRGHPVARAAPHRGREAGTGRRRQADRNDRDRYPRWLGEVGQGPGLRSAVDRDPAARLDLRRLRGAEQEAAVWPGGAAPRARRAGAGRLRQGHGAELGYLHAGYPGEEEAGEEARQGCEEIRHRHGPCRPAGRQARAPPRAFARRPRGAAAAAADDRGQAPGRLGQRPAVRRDHGGRPAILEDRQKRQRVRPQAGDHAAPAVVVRRHPAQR